MLFSIVSELFSIFISTWTVVWIYWWIRSFRTVFKTYNRYCRMSKFNWTIREIVCWSRSSRYWNFTTYTNYMWLWIITELFSIIVCTRTVVWIDCWIRSFWTVFKTNNRCCRICKFDWRIWVVVCWSRTWRYFNITTNTKFMLLWIISKPSAIIICTWTIVWINSWIRPFWTILKINNGCCRICKFNRTIREIVTRSRSCRD